VPEGNREKLLFKGEITMKKTNNKPLLSVILSLVLIVVMALTMFGCTNNKTETPADTTLAAAAQTQEFSFSVTHKDGSVKDFTLTSDKKTVGEALLELKVIEGEDGPYGLYVKTVDGETLDYDTDAMYWAFYENGAYAAKGVDQTEIKADVKYEFRAEK
jgi:hypothetical protein